MGREGCGSKGKDGEGRDSEVESLQKKKLFKKCIHIFIASECSEILIFSSLMICRTSLRIDLLWFLLFDIKVLFIGQNYSNIN